MKPKLIPIYFEPGRDEGFDQQMAHLHELLDDTVQFLAPVALGAELPEGDAVIFPQFLGEGYRCLEAFKAIDLPILVITSEFGTLSMWDWELIDYLRNEGVETIAPYSFEHTQKVIAALRVKRELSEVKFLVYQDNPGKGQQASIFKRFYWWEDECVARMVERFGLTIEKRSYKALGQRAEAISDADALDTQEKFSTPTNGLSSKGMLNATKMYMAVKADLNADSSIRAVGMNCLNESHFSNTTPCLAWNRLYMEDAMIWGCEGDIVSMLTKYILHRSLDAPIIMTNLYPFLMGNAALNHEGISHFPTEIKGDPRDYILVAHCGYMGVVPQPFATKWELKKKVLGIVHEEANVIDALLPTGDITLVKMHSTFDRWTIAEGELEGYAQYPNSDCRNGGIIHVKDGHRMMKALASHHYLLMTGSRQDEIDVISPIFGLNSQSI